MINDTRTIIDLSTSHIKVLQYKTIHNAPNLVQLDIIDTKDKTEAQISESLQKISIKNKSATLVIPKRLVILKQFILPSQDDTEIHKMLSLKILQEVPFTQDEIVFDDNIIEKTKDGYTKLLAAISPIEQITIYLNTFRKANIHITSVLVSSFGIAEWIKKNLETPPYTIGVLNIDQENAEFCFIQDNKFLFSRNFNTNLTDLNEKNMNDIIRQLDITIKAFKLDFPKQNLEKIIISSDLFQIDQFKNELSKRLNIAVELLKPSERIPCDLKVLSLIKNNPLVSIISAWGFVISGSQQQIDLLPHQPHHQQQSQFSLTGYVQLLISLSVLIVMIIISLSMSTYEKHVLYQKLENKLNSIQVESQNETEKLENINKIIPLTNERLAGADLLHAIFQSIPKDLSLKRINLNQEQVLTIEGFYERSGSLDNFKSKLENSGWFKDLTISNQTSNDNNVDNNPTFKITVKAIKKQN